MSDLNIPAIASAAFLGFLALAALLFCVPPVTRFLGDLFCCPWRVPFTRKRRRNDDEEVDKEDLPYLAERRPSSVDDTGYKSTPENYMLSQGTYKHETAGRAFRHQPRRMNYTEDGQDTDDVHYGGSYTEPQAPFPQLHSSRDWWRSRTDEYPDYTEQATHRYHPGYYYSDEDNYYSDEDNYGYDKEIFSGPDIQRPQPAYSPPEMMSQQYTADYFPRVENEYHSQHRRQ